MSLTSDQTALVERVLRKIDAEDSPGSNIVTSHTEIYAVLQEAARLLVLEAPLRLLHKLVTDGTTDVNEDTYLYNLQTAGHTKVVLPSDFVRLAHLELNGWTMGRTHEDIAEDSIVTYRRYLRGEEATTGDPRIFRTWCPARYTAILALTGSPGNNELWGAEQLGFVWQTVIDTVTGLTVQAGLSAATSVAVIGDLYRKDYAYLGTYYSPNVVSQFLSLGSTCRVQVSTSDATVTFFHDTAAATVETMASGAFSLVDASGKFTLLAQRELLDCFPASADSAGDEKTLVSAFNYIPDTAPEDMPIELTDAMLWRAASLLVTALDPQLSQLCLVRSAEALAPRITRHRTAFAVRRRPMGL
jgi:hypothetical protein